MFVIVFLENILIYTPRGVNYEKHVKKTLEKFWQYKLHAKLFKYRFHMLEIDSLKFKITRKNVKMNWERVTSILNWPEPQNHKNVQIFMNFANFYRRFIDKISQKHKP